jgi:hypothetical protein
MNHEETAHTLARLHAVLRDVERDPVLGELEITITPPGEVDLASAQRYEALGVHRLNLQARSALGEEELLRWIDGIGERIVGRV